MNKDIILFDVDGTLVESGNKIDNDEYYEILNKLKSKYEIGIVGGGTLEKIIDQLKYDKIIFDHYFTECGCVYHDNKLSNIYKKNIRNHPLYKFINRLIKLAINYISNVDYNITGHFIDLRNGIIYISLIGMQANNCERKYFIDLDKKYNYRQKLLEILRNESIKLGISEKISINYGGSVGIGIYPNEYDKKQVIEFLNEKRVYNKILYFGDKYEKDGNDYHIINHNLVTGYKINSIEETFDILKTLI